jgi:hypothetical protein
MSAPALEYTTTCRICGKDVARAPSLDIPLVGQPGKRAEKLLAVLLKHLTNHHLQDFQLGQGLQHEFQAFCVLNAFAFADPCVMPRLELTRASVFAAVRKNTLQDSALENITAGFGLDPDDAAKVNEALRAVRDVCCELGQYAPKVPEAASRLVIPSTKAAN